MKKKLKTKNDVEKLQEFQRIVLNSTYGRVLCRYEKLEMTVKARHIKYRVRRNCQAESIISYVDHILKAVDESLEKLSELNKVELSEEAYIDKSYREDFLLELQIAQELLGNVKKLYSNIYEKCAGFNRAILTELDLLDLFQVYELMKEMLYEEARLRAYKGFTNIKDEDFYNSISKIRYIDEFDICGKVEDGIEFYNHFHTIGTGTSEILYYLDELISDKCFDKENTVFYEDEESEEDLEFDEIREFFKSVYNVSI